VSVRRSTGVGRFGDRNWLLVVVAPGAMDAGLRIVYVLNMKNQTDGVINDCV
jgi:hypothetical protein